MEQQASLAHGNLDITGIAEKVEAMQVQAEQAISGGLISAKLGDNNQEDEGDSLSEGSDEGGKRSENSWIVFVEQNVCFRIIVVAVIILNAIQLGASVELDGQGWDSVWDIMNRCFVVIFFIEMIFKLACLGPRRYFFGEARAWNVMDFTLAWVGGVEALLAFTSSEERQSSNLTVFRVLRVLRLIRLVRINRNLFVLAEGIVDAMAGLVWVALLLTVVTYSFAIASAVFLQNQEDTSVGSHVNSRYFGSTVKSMLSLFGVCIGAEWSSIVWPLMDSKHYGLILFFIVYVFIAQFCFLNIIIGIIVDRTNAANEEMRVSEANRLKAEQLAAVKEIGNKFKDYDKSGSNGLTFKDFTALLQENLELRDMLKKDLPTGFHVRDLHTCLEHDSDGILTQDEFEDGVERLIFATPFQDRCLNVLRQASIHREVLQLRTDVKKIVRTEMSKAVAEIKRAMRESSSASGDDYFGSLSRKVGEAVTDLQSHSSKAAASNSDAHKTAKPVPTEGAAFDIDAQANVDLDKVMREAQASFEGLIRTVDDHAREIEMLQKDEQSTFLDVLGCAKVKTETIGVLQSEVFDVLHGAYSKFEKHICAASVHAQEIEKLQHTARSRLEVLMCTVRQRTDTIGGDSSFSPPPDVPTGPSNQFAI